MTQRLPFLFSVLSYPLLMSPNASAENLFGGGATLDPAFCNEHNLRQTVVYVDDSILVVGDTAWAATIYDKLKASLVPGERTTLVELSPLEGQSREIWSGCWPAYTPAERSKLASQSHFFTGDPLASVDKQQGIFEHEFGVAAEKVERKGGRATSVVAINPASPPAKSLLRALVSDGARYARAQETIRVIVYSDLAENSDLGSVFKPLPDTPVNYGAKLGTTLRRSVFYCFGSGIDVKGNGSVQDSIHQFWNGTLTSMSANIGGLGTDLSVPNSVPTKAYSYDVTLIDAGQKTVGRLSLLTDADGTLVDSWIDIVRLHSASINGTFRCIGAPDTSCTLSATTIGGVVSDAPSETLSMSNSSGNGLTGTLGVPNTSADLHLTAAPATD